MARGLDKHRERLEAIAFWGKDLARRAGRTCELCGSADDLRPFDLDPDVEPELDTLVLACETCREVLGGGEADPRAMRFLEAVVWSDVAPVTAAARRMLASIDEDWARDALDAVGAT
jgi:protein PhnA